MTLKNKYLIQIWLLAPILYGEIFATEKQNCDNVGTLIYENMNCSPCELQNGCPAKYICPDLDKPSNKCYYKGQTYENEQFLKDREPPSCNIGCFCDASSNSSKFICAALECAEGAGIPIPKGCYRTFTFNSCCSNGMNCSKGQPYKCHYKGKEYKEGERFFPEDSCSRCICRKGFKGKIVEPFCKRIECGVQLSSQAEVQQKCAPVYNDRQDGSDKLCCPVEWMCPDGSEVITGTPSSNLTCSYGTKSLKVGQGFKRDLEYITNVSCKCLIPPLVTCTGKL